MKYASIIITVILVITSCTNKKSNRQNLSIKHSAKFKMVVDSLLYFRHHSEQTDILSRKYPELSKSQGFAIQLAMLKKELNSGARQIGWKMGGTITKDSANYDPVFGYLLESNVVQKDSALTPKNLPGGSIHAEGEVGFVMSKDFKHGARSVKKMKEGIAYVTNAIELTKATAIPRDGVPDSINSNYSLAAGAGQVGVILGTGKTKVDDFNMKNETIQCFIDDTLAAKGSSANVYDSPIHALYSLVNMLPNYGTYLKKGDVVITGSVYSPPLISKPSNVRVKSSTLGTINFRMK